jgi:DNA-binding NarL/FixJ family response regulator
MKLTTRSRRKEVFIVDDSCVVRERLVALLADVPDVVVVGQAGTAAEAIRQIRKLQPAAVVLDISMPGGNGLSVLREIRRANSAATVIMLTNFSQEQYREKCAALGADYFFDKSTEFEQVRGVLERLESASATDAVTAARRIRTPAEEHSVVTSDNLPRPNR